MEKRKKVHEPTAKLHKNQANDDQDASKDQVFDNEAQVKRSKSSHCDCII